MRFDVRVLNPAGRVARCEHEADDLAQAQQWAQAQGAVLSVLPVGLDTSAPKGLRMRAQGFSLLLFTQHLVGLLRAGLTIVEALEALAENELERSADRAIVQHLLAEVRTGASFSTALHSRPDIFPGYFEAMVRAGEHGGGLVETLSRWVNYQEKVEAANRQVKQALIYPSILVIAGLGVALFLLLYVVPRFALIYDGRHVDLPWLSQVLLSWGRVAGQSQEWVLAGVAVSAFGLWQALRSPRVQEWVVQAAWQVPTLGRRLRVYQLARFYRTVGMLLRGGMPMVQALALLPGLVNPAIAQGVALAGREIESGHPILDALRQGRLTTAVADRMLMVGQRTGEMAEMMERIADYFDQETERALAAFVKSFEPIVMAVVGLLVGGIVVLMYIPIFEIAGSLRS